MDKLYCVVHNIIVYITCLLLLVAIISPIILFAYYASGKEADVYNRLCNPTNPATASDMFWGGRNVRCNSFN